MLFALFVVLQELGRSWPEFGADATGSAALGSEGAEGRGRGRRAGQPRPQEEEGGESASCVVVIASAVCAFRAQSRMSASSARGACPDSLHSFVLVWYMRHRSNLRLTYSYITPHALAAARPHAGASTSLAFSSSFSV